MNVFDLNVKIHVDTSELDMAIKKTERLFALLQEARVAAIPQEGAYKYGSIEMGPEVFWTATPSF